MGFTGNESGRKELGQGFETSDGPVGESLEPFLYHIMQARGENTAHQCIPVVPEGHYLPVLPDVIDGISLTVIDFEP